MSHKPTIFNCALLITLIILPTRTRATQIISWQDQGSSYYLDLNPELLGSYSNFIKAGRPLGAYSADMPDLHDLEIVNGVDASNIKAIETLKHQLNAIQKQNDRLQTLVGTTKIPPPVVDENASQKLRKEVDEHFSLALWELTDREEAKISKNSLRLFNSIPNGLIECLESAKNSYIDYINVKNSFRDNTGFDLENQLELKNILVLKDMSNSFREHEEDGLPCLPKNLNLGRGPLDFTKYSNNLDYVTTIEYVEKLLQNPASLEDYLKVVDLAFNNETLPEAFAYYIWMRTSAETSAIAPTKLRENVKLWLDELKEVPQSKKDAYLSSLSEKEVPRVKEF